jgi:hypothetical protein
MSQPVLVENDAIAMEVWPHIGGKVSSIVDKADRFELLFSYPAELPTANQYDIPYGDSWYQGWDECFPAVAPSRYVGHPYDGITVPDHGELWGLPTTAVPTRQGITTVWHGLRFGYRLTRKLSLDGPSLLAEYTLINLAPFPFHFVWAMHSLMSMTTPVTLDLGAGATDFRLSHDANGHNLQTDFQWPACDGVDLSSPAALPPKRGWKIFSHAPISTPFIVRYPARSRALRIEYQSDRSLGAYWGIWINSGGWAGHRHFAIEPSTGRFDQIDRAIRDSSAGTVDASSRQDWSVRWTLSAP